MKITIELEIKPMFSDDELGPLDLTRILVDHLDRGTFKAELSLCGIEVMNYKLLGSSE